MLLYAFYSQWAFFYLNIFNVNFWKVKYSLFFTFKANWKLLNLIGVIMLNMHSTLYKLSFLGSNIEKWNTLFFYIEAILFLLLIKGQLLNLIYTIVLNVYYTLCKLLFDFLNAKFSVKYWIVIFSLFYVADIFFLFQFKTDCWAKSMWLCWICILFLISFHLIYYFTIFSGNINKFFFPIFIWRTFCFFFNLKPTVELNLSYCV